MFCSSATSPSTAGAPASVAPSAISAAGAAPRATSSSSSGTMTKNDLPGFTPAGTATSNSRPAGVLPLITCPGVAPFGTVTEIRAASRFGLSSDEDDAGTVTANDFPTFASAGTSTSTSPPRGVINLRSSPGCTPSGTVKCILRSFSFLAGFFGLTLSRWLSEPEPGTAPPTMLCFLAGAAALGAIVDAVASTCATVLHRGH